jgi:hypothetical protein
VFWVTQIPEESLKVDVENGTASLHLTRTLVIDAFIVPNSLDSTHPMGLALGIIEQLQLEWSGMTRRLDFRDPTNTFAGLFLENAATIEVTATTPLQGGHHGFSFTPEASTDSLFAEVGRERNGIPGS